MCSQNDDPSQHASDDTLRAALDSASRDLHDAVTRAYDELRAALAASATDEPLRGRDLPDHIGNQCAGAERDAYRAGYAAALAASATDEISRDECAEKLIEAVTAVERPLRLAIKRIGDAYGRIPAGAPSQEMIDAALPALYEAIGDALMLVGHPFAPAASEITKERHDA